MIDTIINWIIPIIIIVLIVAGGYKIYLEYQNMKKRKKEV